MPLNRGPRYNVHHGGGAGSTETTPESISNLLAWWVADEAYITKDGGGLVSDWVAKVDNLGGDGGTWKQTVAVDKPTWNATSCDGKPGLDFDAAFMNGSGTPSWLNEDPYGKTFVFVCDNTVGITPVANYFFAAQAQHRLNLSTSGRFNARIEREGSGANSFLSSTGQLESKGFAVMYKITEVVAGARVDCVVDQYHTDTWENIINSTAGTSGVINSFTSAYQLGALTNSGSSTLDFVIGEVIIYDSILTGDERATLTEYLTNRYTLG